jgi:hypothetical protein
MQEINPEIALSFVNIAFEFFQLVLLGIIAWAILQKKTVE